MLYAVGAEVALRLELPAQVEEAGEALLPARQALAVVPKGGRPLHRLAQLGRRVARWDELLAEIAGVLDLQQFALDPRDSASFS